MADTSQVIDSVNHLLTTLVALLGKGWTIFFIFAIPVGTYFWKRYNNNQKDAVFKKLIQEKDDTISRMKDEVKIYRIHIFKERGWSEDEIDKYIK